MKQKLLQLLARLLSWLLPLPRRERLLSWLEAEEARRAALPPPTAPSWLPWDVAAETGEFQSIFKLSPGQTLSASQLRRLDPLDNLADTYYISSL